jgi:hypothetical protein
MLNSIKMIEKIVIEQELRVHLIRPTKVVASYIASSLKLTNLPDSFGKDK